MSQLHFELRPSLTRLGLSVGLFILISAILSQYIGGVAIGAAMLLILIVLYFFREKHPVQAFAQLDDLIWVIEYKDGTKKHVTLSSVRGFGIAVFFKFIDENQSESVQFCVTKDQVDLPEWKKLMTLVSLA